MNLYANGNMYGIAFRCYNKENNHFDIELKQSFEQPTSIIFDNIGIGDNIFDVQTQVRIDV